MFDESLRYSRVQPETVPTLSIDNLVNTIVCYGGLLYTNSWLRGSSKEMSKRVGYLRERDCMLSHGSVQFLKEKLFDLSDAFEVLVCNDCGVISNDKNECTVCRNNELVRTNIPYAAKLLFQMLNGCLIKTKFHTIME